MKLHLTQPTTTTLTIMSNNSNDDPIDLTDCIVYVKAMVYTDVTENDESINYDELGIFIGIRWVHFTFLIV
jgi:hypothetical protein